MPAGFAPQVAPARHLENRLTTPMRRAAALVAASARSSQAAAETATRRRPRLTSTRKPAKTTTPAGYTVRAVNDERLRCLAAEGLALS